MPFLRFIPLFALLLSGCQHALQPAAAPALCSEAEMAHCAWARDLQQRVARQFDRADRYFGQRCDVTIGYDPQRGYQVLRTEGDEALCLKAWQAVSGARDLPVPPAGAPQQIMVTFRPDRAATR